MLRNTLFIVRSSDKAVEINRFVERCLKESKPVDVESLCIVAGEKVGPFC